ncbi:MAG: WXG100 family type VII secretion target [Pseudonocardiaceae bacterium]
MNAPNPLVAAPTEGSSTEGAGVVDSMWQAGRGIDDGNAAAAAVQGAGAALDLLDTIVDPLSALTEAGVGWLIEHCEPLREPLDLLAGNPQAIEAVSQTWHNIAAEMSDVGHDVGASAAGDTTGWQGQAADAYRRKAAELADEIGAMAPGASGVAGAITTGGVLVGVVRGLVRDLVVECIGDLISKALIAAASSVVTLGGSVGAFLGWAIGKIGITIGRIAAKISELLATLGELLGKLGRLGGAMGELATHTSRYARVRAVTVDRFAATPGRWVASGGPDRLGELGQRGYDRLERWHDATDNYPVKIGMETAKGTTSAVDDYAEQQRQAREEFGGAAR